MGIIGLETITPEKEVEFVLTEIFKVVIVHFGESQDINREQFSGN